MPLHPLAQAFLELPFNVNAKPFHCMTIEECRRVAAEMMSMPAGEPVARMEDLAVPGQAGDIAVRAYTPAGEGPFPILVYFHGGGFVFGGLDSSDAECRGIANSAECVVVSVDYRLAPENKFPAAAEDCYSATSWVAENNARLGGDGLPVAVGGMSAGGNLAAAVSLMARDRGGPSLTCQILNVPVLDNNFDTESYRLNGEGYALTRADSEWFWQQYMSTPDDWANPYAAPLRAPDLSGLPPALVQTMQYDILRDEGRAYAERLRAAGVSVSYKHYEGMLHMVQGPKALSDIASYLKQAFASNSKA
ncbi:MAG TPA: alpha/beta hydrolase [Thermoleophilia bacterium]|nr:alpha/beta hydrolase [Thermoleophilia bacterium]